MGTIYLDGVCYSSGGGGGGASSADQVSLDDTNLAYAADDVQEAFEKVTKSLTYAEYEALTEEEKNNGTIYLITDVNGDGQDFKPVIYSEEEREIGVWKNGQPVYAKILTTSVAKSITTSSWTQMEFTKPIPANIKEMVRMSFACNTQPNFYEVFRLSWDNENHYFKMSCDHNGTFPANTSIYIEYTKTTDTAGSGTWTPQGVPAVHYSTDEQVVGTWIDGSTIYEKALTPSGTFGDVFNYIPHGVSNFNQLLDYFGYCTYGSSDKMNIPNLRGSSYVTISSWDATNIRLEKANLSSALSNVNLVIRYTKSST